MNPVKAIGALEMLALLGALIGEIKNGHAMPRPAVVASIFLFFGILGAVAELSNQAARIATAIAGVTTLASLVSGAAGKNIIGLLNALVAYLPGAPQAAPSAPPPGTTPSA